MSTIRTLGRRAAMRSLPNEEADAASLPDAPAVTSVTSGIRGTRGTLDLGAESFCHPQFAWRQARNGQLAAKKSFLEETLDPRRRASRRGTGCISDGLGRGPGIEDEAGSVWGPGRAGGRTDGTRRRAGQWACGNGLRDLCDYRTLYVYVWQAWTGRERGGAMKPIQRPSVPIPTDHPTSAPPRPAPVGRRDAATVPQRPHCSRPDGRGHHAERPPPHRQPPPMGRARQPNARRHYPRPPHRQPSPRRPLPPPRRTRRPGLTRHETRRLLSEMGRIQIISAGRGA